MEDKAYKLLAVQEGITNRSAKDLIDKGVVYARGKKITVARAMIDVRTNFRVEELQRIRKIFEDENLIAVDKPAFITSEQISKKFKTPLLHRLDKETSGVLLLVKNEEFQKEAIETFRTHKVLKSYEAWVRGRVAESFEINQPILTIKKGKTAYSRVSPKGKEAITFVEPLEIDGKFSKVKVTIKTGRTHQIRVHLAHEGLPIVGDVTYGGKSAKRVLLHAKKIELQGYSFEAPTPKDFKIF